MIKSGFVRSDIEFQTLPYDSCAWRGYVNPTMVRKTPRDTSVFICGPD